MPAQTQLDLPPDAIVLIALLHPQDGALTEPASLSELRPSTASSRGGCQQGAIAQAAASEQSPLPAAADASSAVGFAPAPTALDLGSSDRAADAAANGLASSDDKSSSDGHEEQSGPASTDEPVLVGTFELMFTEAARTKELTLNPPNVRLHPPSLLLARLAGERGNG